MNPDSIQADIVRVRNLWIETASPGARHVRRITDDEHAALARVLDELHRLHVVISTEVREHRETRERAKKARANRRRTNERTPGRPTAPPKKVTK